MANLVKYKGLEMTKAAADWARQNEGFEDLEDLRSGRLTREEFQNDCMEDAETDEDRKAVEEYVEALCKAAGVE